MKKYCLALDLKDDAELIAAYKKHHQAVWPEIKQSIKDSGIKHLEIYTIENRLFMIIEAEADFSFEKKSRMDELNPKVLEWETLMWKYQKALPSAQANQKWVLMDKIFEL